MTKKIIFVVVMAILLAVSFSGIQLFSNENYNNTDYNKHQKSPQLSSSETLFDGLYIKHSFSSQGVTLATTFTYTPYIGTLFNETFNVQMMGTYTWQVDTLTRVMSGGSNFGDGAHTPAWIFTNTSLHDLIPIAVDGVGDHTFNVTRDLIYNLPGFGPIGVWELTDLTQPGGIAWYEKSTGILLNGTFFYNSLGTLYSYTWQFIDTNANLKILRPPENFTLSSDATYPDVDGSFTLSWTMSTGADDYSVYSYSSPITNINGSLTLLSNGITDLTLPLSGYAVGVYNFVVVAHNATGDTLSNCISIDVEHPPPGAFTLSSDAGNPDNNGAFDLSWIASMYANNYSVYGYSSLITSINGSLTLLSNDTTDLTLALSGYASGTDYFIVVAHDAYGDTLSNCIHISVEISPSGPVSPGIPGYNLYLLLSIIFLGSIFLIKKTVKKPN